MVALSARRYGYLRASTVKQEMSPEVQRDSIATFSRSLNFEIDEWFTDAAVSGSVPFDQRPAGGDLDRRLRRGDSIIFAKLDRGFRSTIDCLQCIDRWRRLDVKLYFADLGFMAIDPTSPHGEFMLTLMAALGRLERRCASIRTKEALALRKLKGHANGKYPGYGFMWERRFDREQGKYVKVKVEDPQERLVMKEIVKWRLDGHSFDAIREHVNYKLRLVTRDGRPWSESRIKRAFQAELQLMSQEARIKSA
jgi:DNA invertase Pin-like site-specific DNA recombinase